MKLEIWADFCDPFSCLGVKTLRAAMAQLGVEKFFEIEMKSYETAPRPGRPGLFWRAGWRTLVILRRRPAVC